MHRLWRIGTAIVASAIIGVGAAGPVGAASSRSPAPTGLPPLADVPLFRVNTTANAIQPGPGPTGTPELAWKASIGEMHMTPILVDGLLIAGTNNGRLVALDARSGETRWDTALGVQIQSSLASSDGLVFASDGSAIHAVDIATGIERWSQPLDQASLRLNAVDGIVYIGTTSGVVGFDAPSGREVWRWDGGPSDVAVQAGPIADGVGYFAAGDGRVFAVDTRTGDVRWAVQTISTAVASGQVVGDTFYVSTNQGDAAEAVGEIYAVDRASGGVRWRFRAPSGLQLAQGPSRDGVLYASGLQDGIWALRDDGSSATVLWHVDAPEAHWPMTMVDDTLYEARTDGSVGAYARADGTLLWETPASGAWADGPIVSGGMLFVGDEASGMIAYADPSLIARLPQVASAASPSPAAPSPQAAVPNPFTVVRAFPWADTGIGIPLGMDPGPDGLLYVFDTKPQVTVIDPSDGHVVRRWGRQGAGPGEFDVRRPDDNPGFGDIAVGPDGRVYVADGSNHRVQVFAPDGTFLSQFGSFGTGEGQFGSVTEIVVGPDGSVYTLDDPGRLSKFTADGKFVWRMTQPQLTPAVPGYLHSPAVQQDGTVLLRCEGCYYTIEIDPIDGHVRGRIPTPGFEGSTLTVDPAGHMYLATFGGEAQGVFDTAGHLIGIWYARVHNNMGNGHAEWGDTFTPAPVFLPDGRGYAFGKDGLLELKVTLPD